MKNVSSEYPRETIERRRIVERILIIVTMIYKSWQKIGEDRQARAFVS